METPSYIQSLLVRNGKKAPPSRRVWSIDLEAVWLPFFTATNTMGNTAIPSEALGAPIRLAYNQDGAVKFSKTGKPVTKVVKDLADSVRLVRENFVAGLQAYSNGVATENPDGYGAEVQKAQEAGQPIIANDSRKLSDAIAKQLAEAMEAELKAKPEAVAEPEPKPKAPKPKRTPKVKAEPTNAELDAIEADAKRELVTA